MFYCRTLCCCLIRAILLFPTNEITTIQSTTFRRVHLSQCTQTFTHLFNILNLSKSFCIPFEYAAKIQPFLKRAK